MILRMYICMNSGIHVCMYVCSMCGTNLNTFQIVHVRREKTIYKYLSSCYIQFIRYLCFRICTNKHTQHTQRYTSKCICLHINLEWQRILHLHKASVFGLFSRIFYLFLLFFLCNEFISCANGFTMQIKTRIAKNIRQKINVLQKGGKCCDNRSTRTQYSSISLCVRSPHHTHI